MNSQTQSNESKYSEDMIERASRFLANLLRHGGPDECDLTVNSRGWASGKQVRLALQQHFETNKSIDCSTLLSKVLESDDSQRFQMITDGQIYTMIRAKYGHTIDHIQLYDVNVNKNDLQTFLVREDSDRNNNISYVSAVDENTAQQIFVERHLKNMNQMGDIIVDDYNGSINLNSKGHPYRHYTQKGDEFDEEGRWRSRGVTKEEPEYVLYDQRGLNRMPSEGN